MLPLFELRHPPFALVLDFLGLAAYDYLSNFFHLFCLQVLLSVGWRQNLKFLSLCLSKCFWLHGVSLLQLLVHHIVRKLLFALGYSGRYWLSHHRDWYLLRTSGSRSSYLNSTSEKGSVMNLGKLWLVTTSMRINIVGLHVLTVNSSSVCWICVSVSVGMESWLTEESGQRGVWQPPRAQLQILQLLTELFLLGVIQLLLLLLKDFQSFGAHCLLGRTGGSLLVGYLVGLHCILGKLPLRQRLLLLSY